MVVVGGRGQTEQRLKQPVHAGRPEQVLAAHHVGHALQGVVDRDRQVVAGRRFLARENCIGPGPGIGANRALLDLRPEEKEVFLLRESGEQTFEEIARLRGSPVASGKTLMRSAVRKLRQIIQDEKSSTCEQAEVALAGVL